LGFAAEARSGSSAAATSEAARATLARPSPHCVATLELHVALAAAAHGDPGVPGSARNEHRAWLEALLETLASTRHDRPRCGPCGPASATLPRRPEAGNAGERLLM